MLTVEHAACAVPPGVELGIPPARAGGHEGWDPGALRLAQALAAATGAPLHAGEWSRLVVDLNRREGDPGAVPASAWGLDLPGNRALDPAAREARIARWHRPWRAAVAAAITRALDGADRVLHLSVHSFAPALDPAARDFDLGLLFDPARPAESAWVERLAAALPGVRLARNAPYAGTAEGHTTALRERWGDPRYAGIELELSQDAPPALVRRVAAGLAGALPHRPRPVPA